MRESLDASDSDSIEGVPRGDRGALTFGEIDLKIFSKKFQESGTDVRFSPKRPFKRRQNHPIDSPLSAQPVWKLPSIPIMNRASQD